MLKTEFVQITRQSKIAENEFYPMVNSIYEQIWNNLLPPQLLTDNLSNRVVDNIVTSANAPIPDCLTCGACCLAFICVGVRPNEKISAEYYWDITKEGANGEILVDRYLQRNEETLACKSLEGKIGEQVSCRIYEERPQLCRYFEAGSDRCHAVRRAFGFEPFLTLEEMSEARQKLNNKPMKSASSETIKRVSFVETETGELKIEAYLKDESVAQIHTFNPQNETWRQFEFDGLTLEQAQILIDARK